VEAVKPRAKPIGWNPWGRQWKMPTDNSRIQISEPCPTNIEKGNSSKDEIVLEKSLDELESVQMEDEVKNILVTIINLVIISGDAKAMARHCGKPSSFKSNMTTKCNGNQPIKIVRWN
jgi:hypothetical protein